MKRKWENENVVWINLFSCPNKIKKRVTHYIYIKNLCLNGHFFKKKKRKNMNTKIQFKRGKKKQQMRSNKWKKKKKVVGKAFLSKDFGPLLRFVSYLCLEKILKPHQNHLLFHSKQTLGMWKSVSLWLMMSCIIDFVYDR